MAIVATAALTACNKDEAPKISEYITVSASVVNLVTRATSTAFEVNDKISVYAYESGDVTKLVVENSINTYNGTLWTAVPLMKWKDMTAVHDFVSTYPTRTITDFAAEAVVMTENIATNDVLV